MNQIRKTDTKPSSGLPEIKEEAATPNPQHEDIFVSGVTEMQEVIGLGAVGMGDTLKKGLLQSPFDMKETLRGSQARRVTTAQKMSKDSLSTDQLQMQKYLTILHKVSNAQSEKDKFYSSLLNVKALVSPKLYKKDGGISKSVLPRGCRTDIMKGKLGINKENSFRPKQLNQQFIPVKKEKRAYMNRKQEQEKFFTMIRNKIDVKEGNERQDYQKTLFSSPHFKDNQKRMIGK